MSNVEVEVSALGAARALTDVPRVRDPLGVQFPGMVKYRRKRWRRVRGREGQSNCFHVMSRITDGLPFFEDEDKEALVITLFKMAKFCKVRVVTYCVMGNHFHALIEVPDGESIRERFRAVSKEGEEVGWERLFTHLKCLYSKKYLAALRAQIEQLRKVGRHEEVEEIREAFLKRIGDLSWFMRDVKERFSKWYNKFHGRRGSLWNARFKSVLVQGKEGDDSPDSGYSEAMRTMAAYIDLNPVRAGLVEDAADYPWCGYAAALRGSKRARRGLNFLLGASIDGWESDSTDLSYRQLLLRHGMACDRRCSVEEGGGSSDSDLPMDGEEQVLKAEKEIPRREVAEPQRPAELNRLRVKVRERQQESGQESGVDLVKVGHSSFSKGLAVGDADFVEEVFEGNRKLFGDKRKRGRQKLPESGGLFSLRRVKRHAKSPHKVG